ncbi:MAG: 1-acyl-sn-glycerol-3-phosphate acyltransferase [Pirellulaceae bacterium]
MTPGEPMQPILIEKPYRFIPPHRGNWWPTLIRDFNLPGFWLRRAEGVERFELRGAEHLKESLRAGHGILLTPNHCRLADPLVMGWLAREVRCLVYAMASWHLFQQNRFMAWAIQKMGAFSVYREGVDRQAINLAIEILQTAARPLVVFPEGAVSRTNDRLHALLDGVAFIARTAAKRRAKAVAGGQVVVHPVAIKYLFGGDFDTTADPVLTEIERRLSWQPQHHLRTDQRISKVGLALLSLKEMEYFGRTYADALGERLQRLIDRLLCPLEEEWFGAAAGGNVIPRVKALRMKIMPEMVQGRLDEPERQRRWRQLADIYLAQQVSNYPPEYLQLLSVDRLLETIERLEEDLTDRVRVHGHLKAVVEVGAAIVVSPERERHAPVDPLMSEIERQLQQMLNRLATESPLYRTTQARVPETVLS